MASIVNYFDGKTQKVKKLHDRSILKQAHNDFTEI